MNIEWGFSNNEKPKAVIVVSHPDDETIFCGGTLLYYPDWEWIIVCMTWEESSVRYLQFQKAMQYFSSLGVNIKSFLTLKQEDVVKEGEGRIPGELSTEQFESWKKSLINLKLNPDIVFTHNQRGEYGHPHHIALNKIVNQTYKNVWEFICPGAKNVEQPYKDKANLVPLSKALLEKKMEVFNNCYTSELSIWRNMPDLMLYEFRTGPEIFTQ